MTPHHLTAGIFAIMLFAALLHATWNAIVKGGRDKLMTTALVTGAAGVIAAVLLPFVHPPARASWPYLGASIVLQMLYYVLVASAYRVADMGRVYPLMRGTAPVLVAGAGALWAGMALPGAAWAGIGLICCGVLALTLAGHGQGGRAGIVLALLNAVVIATYTLVDGTGARLSGAPAAYTLWLFLASSPPLLVWIAATRGLGALGALRGGLLPGLAGGAGTLVSYGLALWAMTRAPIAVIAALRETSIVFAMLIAGMILHERIGRTRMAAAAVIATGAVVLRLA
ncbi:EamA family transporter [Gluconacetobacter azotocaptans]|uniref:EamA family transporter n=1 Tax=Gluconacetobacter azotocaptans TaxID=142834 RepID=UPI001F0364CC|nr:EamA family transporter [Gluconacetobacter azotocaptans]